MRHRRSAEAGKICQHLTDIDMFRGIKKSLIVTRLNRQ